jgi:hypothetical protein
MDSEEVYARPEGLDDAQPDSNEEASRLEVESTIVSSSCGMKSEKTPLRFCNFVAGPAWRGIWADRGVLLPSGAARKGDFSSNLKVSTLDPLPPLSVKV